MSRIKILVLLAAGLGALFYITTFLKSGASWEKFVDDGISAYSEGDLAGAEKSFLQAMKVASSFQPDDPRIHFTLNNLIEIYRLRFKYREAEPLIKRILEFDEKALGADHPNVAASLTRLAKNNFRQGKYKEAEALYQRALIIWETSLGKEHPLVGLVLESKADLLHKTGRHEQAAQIEKRAGEIRRKDEAESKANP